MEEKCANVTSLFVILGVTGFGNSWRERQGIIAVGRKKNQHACFQGYQHDRGRIESLK